MFLLRSISFSLLFLPFFPFCRPFSPLFSRSSLLFFYLVTSFFLGSYAILPLDFYESLQLHFAVHGEDASPIAVGERHNMSFILQDETKADGEEVVLQGGLNAIVVGPSKVSELPSKAQSLTGLVGPGDVSFSELSSLDSSTLLSVVQEPLVVGDQRRLEFSVTSSGVYALFVNVSTPQPLSIFVDSAMTSLFAFAVLPGIVAPALFPFLSVFLFLCPVKRLT